jgi:type I restriction enzyme S subunit
VKNALQKDPNETEKEFTLYDLPKAWSWAEIEDAGAFSKNAIVDGPFGSNLKVSDYVEDGSIPVLTTKNIDGTLDGVRYISKEKFKELARSAVHPNDILMAKIGSCGKVGVYPPDGPLAMIPANLLKVSLNQYFSLHFVRYYFTSEYFKKTLKTIIKATAQPAFGITSFKRLPLPVAPENEQARIVFKIDELFSSIEEGERALERVRKLVERYRVSVLKAAVTGKLTREWREKHAGKLESGEALLTRILEARRKAWEKSELDKMMAQGRRPADDSWKRKYKEPAICNILSPGHSINVVPPIRFKTRSPPTRFRFGISA